MRAHALAGILAGTLLPGVVGVVAVPAAGAAAGDTIGVLVAAQASARAGIPRYRPELGPFKPPPTGDSRG